MRVSVCRKAHFNAAHRLHNKAWTAEKNEQVFGKCNNPNYHGHNYKLEVWVSGEIDEEELFKELESSGVANISFNQVRKMVKMADTDGDGVICKDEWVNMIMKKSTRRKHAFDSSFTETRY